VSEYTVVDAFQFAMISLFCPHVLHHASSLVASADL